MTDIERKITAAAWVQGACIIGLLLGVPGVENSAMSNIELAYADSLSDTTEGPRAAMKYSAAGEPQAAPLDAMTEAEQRLYHERQQIKESLDRVENAPSEPIPQPRAADGDASHLSKHPSDADGRPGEKVSDSALDNVDEVIEPGLRD